MIVKRPIMKIYEKCPTISIDNIGNFFQFFNILNLKEVTILY